MNDQPQKKNNRGKGALLLFIFIIMIQLLFIYPLTIAVEDLKEKIDQVEYASNSRAAGIFDQLERIEQQVISYEDGMEAIALVLERNTGYYLYQELGVVVMSHEYYLKKGY